MVRILFLLALAPLLACSSPNSEQAPPMNLPLDKVSSSENPPVPRASTWQPGDFDRSEIEARLTAKREANEPWIAHVLVPLCDNDHQGIVPVNASLGNGQSTRTNLYWGAGYGLKTHFSRASDWKTLLIDQPESAHILERAIFEKTFSDGHRVILVAEAYDGAFMKTCLEDYFAYLTGSEKLTANLPDGRSISYGSASDLIAINGHNGLMDVDVSIPTNQDKKPKDAVAIACISHDYFREPLAQTGGYPLLCTTGLMAPEAYVMRAILDAWGSGKSPTEIRTAAGAAYHRYQKCGIKGATNLFKTGW